MKKLLYFVIAILVIRILFYRVREMKTSENGKREIEKHEGRRKTAYKDTKGLWTIGIGHLIQLPKEEYLLTATLTDKEINELFKKDLSIAERAVNALGVPLTQNQFDALVSIAFNVGVGNFAKSELAKALKKLDYKRAAELIVEKGFHPERRKQEQKLFLA